MIRDFVVTFQLSNKSSDLFSPVLRIRIRGLFDPWILDPVHF
jgi:hypothetical protein